MKNSNDEPISSRETAIGLLGQDTVEELEKAGLMVMWKQDWDKTRNGLEQLVKRLSSEKRRKLQDSL